MSGQTRGVYLELVVLHHLTDLGYFCVRSAGSHGVADVVAIKASVALLVQAKVRLSLLGSREWTELWNAAQAAGAVPVVASRPSPRKLEFHRLTGPRLLNARSRPMEVFLP